MLALPADLVRSVAAQLDCQTFFRLRTCCQRLAKVLDKRTFQAAFPIVDGARDGLYNRSGELLGVRHGWRATCLYRYGHTVGYTGRLPYERALVSSQSVCWKISPKLDTPVLLFRRYHHSNSAMCYSVVDRGWTSYFVVSCAKGVMVVLDRKNRLRHRTETDMLGRPCGSVESWYVNGKPKRRGRYRLDGKTADPQHLWQLKPVKCGQWTHWEPSGRTVLRQHPP